MKYQEAQILYDKYNIFFTKKKKPYRYKNREIDSLFIAPVNTDQMGEIVALVLRGQPTLHILRYYQDFEVFVLLGVTEAQLGGIPLTWTPLSRVLKELNLE